MSLAALRSIPVGRGPVEAIAETDKWRLLQRQYTRLRKIYDTSTRIIIKAEETEVTSFLAERGFGPISCAAFSLLCQPPAMISL